MTEMPFRPLRVGIAMFLATAIALPAAADGGTAAVSGAVVPGERNAAAAGESGERAGPPGNAGAAPGEPDSRLLRALALGPVPAGPQAPEDAVPFAAEGCPRGLLRRLLAGAADEAGALSALAVEQELLVLCRERQEIVAGLLETEARLRELRAPGEEPGPGHTPSPAARDVVGTPVAAVQAPPPPLPASPEGAAGPAARVPPQPRYGWFSIIGAAGALRAGVTDGSGVWFVREGDALPGGGTVAAISGRPPGVRLAAPDEDGGETPLPYRARPGGGP